MITRKRFIVDLLDDDNSNETEQFIRKYGADEITGMTNGDVMKIVFPNVPFNEFNEGNPAFVAMDLPNPRFSAIDKEWWDAPYKAESEAVG